MSNTFVNFVIFVSVMIGGSHRAVRLCVAHRRRHDPGQQVLGAAHARRGYGAAGELLAGQHRTSAAEAWERYVSCILPKGDGNPPICVYLCAVFLPKRERGMSLASSRKLMETLVFVFTCPIVPYSVAGTSGTEAQ